LRPPTLFILARNPCVRLRLTTEGWNVRFMVVDPEVKKPYIRARYHLRCQSCPAWRRGSPPRRSAHRRVQACG
jgi:hypothetical protein